MAISQTNPLVISDKSSDSRLSVQLHPLVIITISDYVTRHVLRQKAGPVVGAIIGQQNGREITMEHAFECRVTESSTGMVVIDDVWFKERLQQYRDVHKDPPLDYVAWFALCPSSGPQPYHVPIHQHFSQSQNESTLFLAFQPEVVDTGKAQGGRLPFSIYESVLLEGDPTKADAKSQNTEEAGQVGLRFCELSYVIETGDAEMIGVDSVAKGGANAAASIEASSHRGTKGSSSKTPAGPDVSETKPGNVDSQYLAAEDDDAIAALHTKANAIRMLQQRIRLLRAYLESLPPSYLSDPSLGLPESNDRISYPILRSIAALLARLNLQGAYNRPTSAYSEESASQISDTALLSLLGSLTSTLQSTSQLGKTAGVVETSRNAARRRLAGKLDSGVRGPAGADEGYVDDPGVEDGA